VVASFLFLSVGAQCNKYDCNKLQNIRSTHCKTLHFTATGAGGKFLVIVSGRTLDPSDCNTLHYIRLQHTATCCNTLQQKLVASFSLSGSTLQQLWLQHTVTYLTATHCNTLQQEVVASVLSSSVGSLDPSDCNTLQHTGAGGKFLVIVSGRTLDPSLASSS